MRSKNKQSRSYKSQENKIIQKKEKEEKQELLFHVKGK